MGAEVAGVFIAVVGKSGVGKDAIMTAARPRIEKAISSAFPRRYITRPENAGGEDHIAISKPDFLEAEQSGKFILSWSAHGHHYGVPKDICDCLEAGQVVILNISRGAVQEANSTFEKFGVIEITANPQTIEKRLHSRGRETVGEIADRQARTASPNWAADVSHIVIENDGTLEEAVSQFVDAVLSLSGQTAPREQTVQTSPDHQRWRLNPERRVHSE